MNCSHKSSGSLQPIVARLNEAAQCALDTLQGVQLALSIPQEAERAKQLEEVERDMQTPICKSVKLIAPARSSPEKFPCGPGFPLVPSPGAEVIPPSRRALGPWIKKAAETIDGFLQGRYMRPCCAIAGVPVGEPCQATDEVNLSEAVFVTGTIQDATRRRGNLD